MGCDIHPTVEVRQADGSWQWAGEVFDSTNDWKHVAASQANLSRLDTDQLLEVLDFYVTHEEYGHLRPHLSAKTVEVFLSFEERIDLDRALIRVKRDEISDRPEGWDYSIVKAYEQGLADERHEHFKDSLTDEQRAEVIKAAVDHFNTDDYAEEDPRPISLSRRASDPPFKTHEPFDTRNYDLFAALAGVRNGSGFAGVYTGEKIKPIAEPRGIPEDADPATVKCLSDEHTPSWLTLTEMRAYDWEQPKVSGGLISGEFYDFMRKHQEDLYPWDEELVAAAKEAKLDTGVCGGISGQGIVEITEEQYAAWKLRPHANILGTRPYVRIKWTRPLRASISDAFFEGLDQMDFLIPENGTADDVRLVFDYDS